MKKYRFTAVMNNANPYASVNLYDVDTERRVGAVEIARSPTSDIFTVYVNDSPSDTKPTCGNCTHWLSAPDGRGPGICRRYPPIPVAATDRPVITVWPLTSDYDRCAEHAWRTPFS